MRPFGRLRVTKGRVILSVPFVILSVPFCHSESFPFVILSAAKNLIAQGF